MKRALLLARFVLLTAVRVLIEPRLWGPAIRGLKYHARPEWYRRFPFLPLPPRRWWEFRMEMAYGDKRALPRPEDVVEYLKWASRG